jgi:photosystem II stability/assembly factor-like uncharacterized protein
MAVAPSDPETLLLATSNGVYRSVDGGKKWKATGPKDIDATSLVQFGDSIYLGGVASPSSPAGIIRKGAIRTVPDGDAILAVTTDDGKTWRRLKPRGLPNVAIQALVVDPGNTASLYALLNTGRLYRSTDGAKSFKLVTSQLGTPPWALAITDKGQFVAGNMDTGHYVSPNGKAWQQTPYKDQEGARHVMEFAVQPGNAKRVLMTSTGVERSNDGGKSWDVVLKTDVMFGPIAWVPTESDVAFAVGFDRTLWRSDDAGETWKKVA